MIYQTFAKLYDDLFEPEMYYKWLDFSQKHLDPAAGAVLDLACGAGRFLVMLKKAGFEVVGSDFSEEMLSLAEQHARQAQVKIPLILGDMSQLATLGVNQAVSQPIKAITCYADSLCYLPDAATIKQTFAQVYATLAKSGKFLFDVITPYQVDEVYPGFVYNYEAPDESKTFVWHSYACADDHGEKAAHCVEHDLSFFIRQDEGTAQGYYQKVSELHHERTYPLTDWQNWLKEAGFSNISVSADFGKKPVDKTTTRAFFVATKED